MKVLTSSILAVPMCLAFAAAQDQPSTPQATPQSTPQRTSSAAMAGSQTLVGILVDSKCSSSGMSASSSAQNTMPRGTGSGQVTPTETAPLMNRTSPGASGRDFNSTDRNTSGSADRVGTPTGTMRSDSSTATPRDMSKGTATDQELSTQNQNRTTPRPSAMDRADNRTGSEMPRGSDMPRTTGETATGRGFDTQSENNPYSKVASASNMNGNWDRTCFISPASTSFVLQLQDGRTLKVDDAGNSRISSQLQSSGRVSSKNKVFRVRVTGSVDGDTVHVSDIQM